MKKIIVILIVILVFAGCQLPMGVEKTSVYWIQPDNTITKSAFNTEPAVKYTHKSFGDETTSYSGVITSDGDPTSITVILSDMNFSESINNVSITLIFTANGVEDSITLTESNFEYSGGGIYNATIWDSSFFPNGIDFYDADGDGEFLNLDNYPNSDDYSILAFESVSINGTSYTLTNPGL